MGLLATAAGALGIAANVGLFGDDRASAPVIDAATQSYAASHDWYWPVVAGVAVLVLLLALRWLLVQLRHDTVSEVRWSATGRWVPPCSSPARSWRRCVTTPLRCEASAAWSLSSGESPRPRGWC